MEKKNQKKSDDTGLMKNGKSRRARAGRAGRGKGIPRVMIGAGVLILAGAAWLYWPAGSSEPTGLGEHRTIVSEPVATGANGPSSGDVDINEQTASLTPEASEDSGSTENPAIVEEVTEQEEQATPPAAPVEEKKPARKPAAKPAEPVQLIQPATSGQYAVQIGSFGNAANADKEVSRLKALGWDTRVRAGNNSAGQMVFRVWITFFSSRQEAQKFIDQNSKHVPGAIPVHR